jgi:predicted RNA-binding Zn-ribbon protein involved in translation (DUF1610 family)
MLEKSCANCGKLFHARYDAVTKQRKYCSKTCARTGEKNPNFRKAGSTHIDDMGGGLKYRVIKTPDGKWRREHRVLMEQILGRKLRPGEHVHHINGNGLDNRLENLILLPAVVHLRQTTVARLHACTLCGHKHLPGKASEYHACPVCGRTHQAKKSRP